LLPDYGWKDNVTFLESSWFNKLVLVEVKMKNVVYIHPKDWDRVQHFLTDWIPMIVPGRISMDDVVVGYRPQLLGM
jgi:hypothetical protein